MTYLGQTELGNIRARDAEGAETWFTGPASFTAQAARDRRALLGEVDRLVLLVRQQAGERIMALICRYCGQNVENAGITEDAGESWSHLACHQAQRSGPVKLRPECSRAPCPTPGLCFAHGCKLPDGASGERSP